MSFDQEMNGLRLEHGTQVVERFARIKDRPYAADMLIEAYAESAIDRTDTGDFRTLVTDLMADVAHHAIDGGADFRSIVDGVDNGDGNDHSTIFRLMRQALAEHGEDYASALAMAEIHVNSELDFPGVPRR
jgi:hypothetical protein